MEALMLPPVTGHRRLPNSLTQNDQGCQNCHEPGANMVCANCKVADIGSLSTRYCSRDCQMEHWQDHKKICNDRRRLTRATRVLNTIWETFAELTYVNRFMFVGKAGRTIHMTCLSQNEALDHGGWTGETIFRDFSQDVMGGNQDEDVKQALLHDNGCNDAISTGLGLIKSLLTPVCSKITEVRIKAKGRALVVEIGGNPTTDVHTILRAKLESGEEFSIDVTGAQFGWQEKIYTWRSFTQHRAESIEDRLALGGTNLHEALMVESFPADQIHRAAYDLRQEIARDVVKSITAFFSEKQTSVWNFMSQANSTFPSQSAELVSKATMAIHGSIHKLTVERGIGRWYVEVQPSKFALKVLRGEELARRMKRVWLSQKQVDGVRLKFAHLPKRQMEKACLEKLSDIVMKRWVKSMYCRRG
ncbi:unnamed protein product [Clonostachys solani]|uniref:MYND-type domain-containing protein n=1 Tax=Clonostachys solani TaxID=160281 RepID=A0A9N9ZKQ9_9HYPO|nr:unnamed protein product [Clonostachys solani]